MALILFLLAPLVIIALAQRVPFLDRIGVVPLAFLLGFLLVLLVDLEALFGAETLARSQQTAAEVSVAFALPLIIFAANIRLALQDARQMLLAILSAFASVVAVSALAVSLFHGALQDVAQIAALSVGAYTGSGMNMGAINTAINGDSNVFLTMITHDILFSGIYMLVVVLAGQRLAGLLLRPFKNDGPTTRAAQTIEYLADDSAHGYIALLRRGSFAGSAMVLIAAAVIVGVSVAAASLFPPAFASTVTILLITTLGLVGSMIPQLHRVTTSYHLGMFLILIFCFATATMLDPAAFMNINWSLGGYFLSVIFGSMILHAGVCRALNIDRDTYLVASGAAVMSVPFIPVIIGALRNRALLVPGLAVAVLGYAAGNYLGIAFFHIAQAALGNTF